MADDNRHRSGPVSTEQISRLVEGAKPAVFWSDRDDAPDPTPSLVGKHSADLVIVGGGFSGLWAALQSLEENPNRSVVVLEAESVGFGASSRNGGFCDPSLTHGAANGYSHWANDMPTLHRLGEENLAGIVDTLTRYRMKTPWWKAAEVSAATQEWQMEELGDAAEQAASHGHTATLLDQEAMRAIADSPTYVGGLSSHEILLVDPARLVWDLKVAVESLGGVIHDQSRVTGIEPDGSKLIVMAGTGSAAGMISADKVIVATNAWAEPGKYIRHYVLPIYDHVLMTEPLSAEQLSSIGWSGREGLADSGNQFHYYRLTEDNRILWGGYDANYYFGNGMGPKYENLTASHELIAGHFFQSFPQLVGLGFSHRWAGPIGTTSKFAAAFGTRHKGRLAWVAGYTGLGVGASRFGARVALDLVDGKTTERTELEMVRKKPIPIPPEPLRYAAVQLTRRAIVRADANHGKRGLLLQILDRFGVGFDS